MMSAQVYSAQLPSTRRTLRVCLAENFDAPEVESSSSDMEGGYLPMSPRARKLPSGVAMVLASCAVIASATALFMAVDSRCSALGSTTHPACALHANARALFKTLQTVVRPSCKEETVACGGLCLPGAADSACCVGEVGGAILCGAGSECCDGVCMANGTGCANKCKPGLISCGGVCIVGTKEDHCCIGPLGNGIMCDASSVCCDGVCTIDGTGCSKECSPGMVSCGGECLVGTSEDVCCEGPSGKGIVCNSTAQCCSGVCLMDGQGCAKQCGPGLMKCGEECLPADVGSSCCVGESGAGIVCDGTSECCNGVCVADGTGCDPVCAEGTVSCGGVCLAGTLWDVCCIGPAGNGILCESTAQCCDGVCLADGQGCAKTCALGMVHCGGECMVGTPRDTCCVGPTGGGIICGAEAECCDGVCAINGTGCARHCDPDMIACGGVCLPAEEASSCCRGPTGNGIVCDKDAQCCDGLCTADGTGCAKTCGPGLVSCGGQCLSGSEKDVCCLGPSGAGIMCGSSAQCCDGVCLQDGQGCAMRCSAGLIQCGGQCLPGDNTSTCCLGPTSAGVLCGPDDTCCGGLCEAKGSPCGLSV